jgi:hypothetical protein
MAARPFLLIAHPGHELLVHRWLTETRPRVCVLTDGSGRAGVPRTHYSVDLLAATGATRGPIFGRYGDLELYRALLDGTTAMFVDLARELAADLAAEPPSAVMTDAQDGYNPVHDLCRWIAGAALAISGHDRVPQYEFSTTGRVLEPGLRVVLDDESVERKLAAARSYDPLHDEVIEKLQRFGPDFPRTEVFAAVARWNVSDPFHGEIPEYERIGAQRVAAGIYREAIRFRENLLPVADALSAAVERSACLSGS